MGNKEIDTTSNMKALFSSNEIENIIDVVFVDTSDDETNKQIERIMQKISRSTFDKLLIIVTAGDPNGLAKTILGNTADQRKRVPRKTTIIQFDAPKHTDIIEPETGIRIVTLPHRAIKFQTHPTPAS